MSPRPCWAGLIAIADQFRTAEGLSLLDGPRPSTPSPTRTPTISTTSPAAATATPAGVGYDMATGIGGPMGRNLLMIPALAATVGGARSDRDVTDSGSMFFTPAT